MLIKIDSSSMDSWIESKRCRNNTEKKISHLVCTVTPISLRSTSVFFNSISSNYMCVEVRVIHAIHLCALRPPWWNLVWGICVNRFRIAKRNCLCIWVVLYVPFHWSVKVRYRSSVAVVSRRWPSPGRRLIFPVSWKWFQSLKRHSLPLPFIPLHTFIF